MLFYQQPVLDSNIVDDIYNTARKIFDNLDIATSLGHTEMIIEDKSHDVYVVESHLRAGGDCIPDLIENVSGYNPYYLFFKALDREPLPPNTNNGQSGIFYFIPDIGKISKITNYPPKTKEDVFIKDRLDFTSKEVKSIQNSFDRKWGYIMLSGSNVEEMANKYLSEICIEYDNE